MSNTATSDRGSTSTIGSSNLGCLYLIVGFVLGVTVTATAAAVWILTNAK